MSGHVEAALHDAARLAALRSLALLDTATEPAFDRLTRLATRLLDVPTALVSLVDEDRQFFKSCVGLREPWASRRETPLTHSFCQYAVELAAPFIVEDARTHPLVYRNLAIDDLGVVAYAGIPLITSDGCVLGTFCVADRVPRKWSAEDLAELRDLTGMVMTEIELRSEIAERRRVEQQREQLLIREQAARLAAEQAERRLAFLADASRILSSTLSYETALAAVVDLGVPAFVERCEMYVLDEQGQLRLIPVAGQPTDGLLPERMCAAPFDPRWEQHPAAHVLSSKTSVLVTELSDAYLHTLVGDSARLAVIRAAQPTSLMAVPIQTRAHVFGLIVALTSAERRFNQDDVTLAEEIGRRAALAIDNARLYGKALQAVRVRDDVLAIVSHDLRRPLGVVRLYADLLRRYAQQASTSGVLIENGAAQIAAAGRQMSRLVGELMDVAALQIGKTITLNYGWTDLVALVDRVAGEYQQTTQHMIRVEAAVPQLRALVDEDRIERVLANLLGNAIKYSPQGGQIVVSSAPEEQGGSWAVLTVQDHGLGIPADDLPHIFQQFYRAANVPAEVEGTGIGLASVRQIVELHRGTITASSAEGAGTTFTVRLPLTRPA